MIELMKSIISLMFSLLELDCVATIATLFSLCMVVKLAIYLLHKTSDRKGVSV